MSTLHQHSKEEPLCIIWDCDGTLLDTETQSSQIIADIMESARPGTRDIEFANHASIIGMPTELWVQRMMDKAELNGLIDPKVFAERYIEGMKRASSSFKKMKGADSLTRFFYEQGIKQCMATSTPRSLIGAKLAPHNEMINRFEHIVTAEDVAHGKPAPDIFLKAAELAGVPPHRCIVFEDSPLGVQGGLAAGMAVVAIAFPGLDRSLFKGACQVLENLSQFDSTAFGLEKYVCDEI